MLPLERAEKVLRICEIKNNFLPFFEHTRPHLFGTVLSKPSIWTLATRVAVTDKKTHRVRNIRINKQTESPKNNNRSFDVLSSIGIIGKTFPPVDAKLGRGKRVIVFVMPTKDSRDV